MKQRNMRNNVPTRTKESAHVQNLRRDKQRLEQKMDKTAFIANMLLRVAEILLKLMHQIDEVNDDQKTDSLRAIAFNEILKISKNPRMTRIGENTEDNYVYDIYLTQKEFWKADMYEQMTGEPRKKALAYYSASKDYAEMVKEIQTEINNVQLQIDMYS